MTFIYQNVSENLSGGQCACIAHVLHYIIYTNVFLPLLFYKMHEHMYVYLSYAGSANYIERTGQVYH